MTVLRRFSTMVTKNAQHVLRLRDFFDQRVGRHQRIVERTTLWLGRPATIYLLIAACVFWGSYNLWFFRFVGVRLDPPPFFWMQGALCLYGAIVTTLVLAAQNHRNRETEQRSHLQLQLQLTTEQKTTKLLELLEALRTQVPTAEPWHDPLVQEMLEQVDPHTVLAALEDVETTTRAANDADRRRT